MENTLKDSGELLEERQAANPLGNPPGPSLGGVGIS